MSFFRENIHAIRQPEPTAVIANLKPKISVEFRNRNPYLTCGGVPQGVSQCFLNNSEHRHRSCLRQALGCAIEIEDDFRRVWSATAVELGEVTFQGGGETEF